MKVIYKKSILEMITEENIEAKLKKQVIEKIILNTQEANEFKNEIMSMGLIQAPVLPKFGSTEFDGIIIEFEESFAEWLLGSSYPLGNCVDMFKGVYCSVDEPTPTGISGKMDWARFAQINNIPEPVFESIWEKYEESLGDK